MRVPCSSWASGFLRYRLGMTGDHLVGRSGTGCYGWPPSATVCPKPVPGSESTLATPSTTRPNAPGGTLPRFHCQGEGRGFESRRPLHGDAGQRPSRGPLLRVACPSCPSPCPSTGPTQGRPSGPVEAGGMRGSLRQRSAGSFELRVYIGVDPTTGRRRYRSMTVRGNRGEAERELAAAFSQAMRWGWIWDNPAEHAHRIVSAAPELRPPTPEELRALLDHFAAL